METLLLAFLTAMALSMAIIPVMIRLAPRLGMVDQPDPRKVHAVPIPRVGGVGIVLGALISVMLWLPLDTSLQSWLFGSFVLLAFGVWDDAAELGHYVKFIGQFIAAMAVVYWGDVVVLQWPFMGMEPISPEVGKPLTVISIVGMINAINHSDGLDGLAGGESLMSLAGIAWLAWQAEGMVVLLVALAAMGGILGFLRYNSHPAQVFMGDGGSQFLGFTLGVLVVLLTQDVNPALSPAVAALLLGLPIVDILSVFAQRVYSGMNWFRATKNHIHHRLLELGFHHYEAVIIIYGAQLSLVLIGVSLPYESDALLLGLYLAICLGLLAVVYGLRARGWHAHEGGQPGFVARVLDRLRVSRRFETTLYLGLQWLLVFYLLAGAITVVQVPPDMALSTGAIAALLTLRLALGYRVWFLFLRFLVFVALASMVYLVTNYPPPEVPALAFRGYMGVLAVMVVLAARYARKDVFAITPLDYLVVMILLIMAVVPGAGEVAWLVTELIILFYAGEITIRNMKRRWNPFTVALAASMFLVSVRGLLG